MSKILTQLSLRRPGVPPERFLLYDSQEDAAYVGRRMLLFASDWGLDHLAVSKHWAADGTFKVSPNVFLQVTCVLTFCGFDFLLLTFCGFDFLLLTFCCFDFLRLTFCEFDFLSFDSLSVDFLSL